MRTNVDFSSFLQMQSVNIYANFKINFSKYSKHLLWKKTTINVFPILATQIGLDYLPVLLPRVQFASVCFPQFRRQDTYYVDKEEEIHLEGQRCTARPLMCHM